MILPRASSARNGTALALARLPFAFTQDRLLTSADFIQEAERRGHRLTLRVLSDLHDLGLLMPIFHVCDSAVVGRRIAVPHPGAMNPRGSFYAAAADGRLRDVANVARTIWEPHERPADETRPGWWNGFLYSEWQLLSLRHALDEYEFHNRGWRIAPATRLRDDRDRRLVLAMCALATRHLPSILGTQSVPVGYDADALWRSRFDIDDRDRLALIGFDPNDLREEAERLLLDARAVDPMIEWLPLLRHASHEGWQKLRGPALAAHQTRIAAELLLRSHDELATEGLLEPLPVLSPQGWRSPLHDRLTARGPAIDSLDRALGSFGLSPYPRVLLLVEGDTEMVHIPRLLEIYGLNRPDRVRIQNAGGSKVNPQLVARYAISPRIGPTWGGHQFLDATPTALVVAMDPENKWKTAEARDAERGKLQKAIRDEVHQQGADITDKDLDFLIRIFVWGEHTYELANFTDAELVV